MDFASNHYCLPSIFLLLLLNTFSSFLPVFRSQIHTIVREPQSGLGVSHASGSLGEAKSIERWRRMQRRYEEVTQRNVETSGD